MLIGVAVIATLAVDPEFIFAIKLLNAYAVITPWVAQFAMLIHPECGKGKIFMSYVLLIVAINVLPNAVYNLAHSFILSSIA